MGTISHQPFVVIKPPQNKLSLPPTTKQPDINFTDDFCSIEKLDNIANQLYAKQEYHEYLNNLPPVWPLLNIGNRGNYKPSVDTIPTEKSSKKETYNNQNLKSKTCGSKAKQPKLDKIVISDSDSDSISSNGTSSSRTKKAKSVVYVPPHRRNQSENKDPSSISQMIPSTIHKVPSTQKIRKLSNETTIQIDLTACNPQKEVLNQNLVNSNDDLKKLHFKFFGNNQKLNCNNNLYVKNLSDYCQAYFEYFFSKKALKIYPDFAEYLSISESKGCEIKNILSHNCFDNLNDKMKQHFTDIQAKCFVMFSIRRSNKFLLDKFGFRRSSVKLINAKKKANIKVWKINKSKYKYKMSSVTSKILLSLKEKYLPRGNKINEFLLQLDAGKFFHYVRKYFDFCLSEKCFEYNPGFSQYIKEKEESQRNMRWEINSLIKQPVFEYLYDEVINLTKQETVHLFSYFLKFSAVLKVDKGSIFISSLALLFKDFEPKYGEKKKKIDAAKNCPKSIVKKVNKLNKRKNENNAEKDCLKSVVKKVNQIVPKKNEIDAAGKHLKSIVKKVNQLDQKKNEKIKHSSKIRSSVNVIGKNIEVLISDRTSENRDYDNESYRNQNLCSTGDEQNWELYSQWMQLNNFEERFQEEMHYLFNTQNSTVPHYYNESDSITFPNSMKNVTNFHNNTLEHNDYDLRHIISENKQNLGEKYLKNINEIDDIPSCSYKMLNDEELESYKIYCDLKENTTNKPRKSVFERISD